MDIKVFASGSSGNACFVSDGKTKLLLDAGISKTLALDSVGLEALDIDGCLVTHEHNDHSRSVKDLVRYGMNVYMSAGTAMQLEGLNGHRVKIIKALQQFRIGSFAILPFDVQHDAAEPLGFLLTSDVTGEKLLYFTDTYYLKYRFNGLTHMLVECNYSMPILEKNVADGLLSEALARRIIKSHMSLEHLLEFLQANDLSRMEKIYLIHMSNTNGDEAAFGEAVRRATGVEVYVC